MTRTNSTIALTSLTVLLAAHAQAQGPPPVPSVGRPSVSTFVKPPDTVLSLLDLIGRTDVQNELRLDLRQRNAVGELSLVRGAPIRAAARLNSPSGESLEEQIRKQVDRQFDGIEAKVRDLLKPDQFKRLLELDAQWRGPVALGDARVAERVQLTAAHRSEIARIVGDYQRQRSQIIFEHAQVNRQGDGTDRVAMTVRAPDLTNPLSPVRKALDPLRKDTEEKILRILDAGEKERWNAAQGDRFTFRSDDRRGASSRY